MSDETGGFSTEPRTACVWMRDAFQQSNSRHAAQKAPARTVRRDFTPNPATMSGLPF
jgi:hypothetical protein